MSLNYFKNLLETQLRSSKEFKKVEELHTKHST